MAWARNSTTGALTHSGSNRDFWMIGEDAPVRAEFKAGCTAVSGNVKIAVRTSADGATCFECGIDGANLVIRQLQFGAEVPPIVSVAHGIAASIPFVIRVVLDGDAITAYAGISPTSEVSVTFSAATNKRYSHRYGVVSAVNGAVVSWFEVGEITNRILTLEEVGVAVIGGGVYRSINNGQWELVDADIFPPDIRVGIAAHLGEAFMVGGGLARVYRPITNVVALWIPTVGTLPGQTTDGTTTATLIEEHLGGIVLNDTDQSLSIKGSKLNDAYDWQTNTGLYGSAYEIGVGDNATVGDPIVALGKGPGRSLFIACRNSTNFMVGDPYRQTHEIVTRSETVGASGPDSILRAAGNQGQDLQLMHAPEGLHVCPPGGAPVDISSPVLKKHVSFPKASQLDFAVVMARDPSRQWVHLFIDAGTTDSVHLIYDQSIGGFATGGPGWYPIQVPVRICAAALVRGRVILGTTDGRLVRFTTPVEGTVEAVELGSDIESVVTMALVDLPDSDNDVKLRKPRLVLGIDSGDVELSLYGAVTAEGVYKTAERRRKSRGTFRPKQRSGVISARAPFLVPIARTVGERLILEAMEARITRCSMSTAGVWTEPAEAEPFCTPPGDTGLPTAPDPPAPPGPPEPPPTQAPIMPQVPEFDEEDVFGEDDPFSPEAVFTAGGPTFSFTNPASMPVGGGGEV